MIKHMWCKMMKRTCRNGIVNRIGHGCVTTLVLVAASLWVASMLPCMSLRCST